MEMNTANTSKNVDNIEDLKIINYGFKFREDEFYDIITFIH